MKNQLLSKRIPTILGIGLVVLTIILTTGIVKKQTNLMSRASNSEEPQNIKITNLSDDSFTVTYQTDAATTGSINYGKNKELGNTELDDSDKKSGDFSRKNIHSITAAKLSPNTKYYAVIISGQNTFLNNGAPFEITTAPNIASSSALKTHAKGKVVLPDGNVPSEALVYLNAKNSQLLSSIVGKDGQFSFSLKSLRTEDLSSYLKVSENEVLKLTAINNSLKSTVFVSLDQANSVPSITLSNDYDFTHTDNPAASKSAESESLGFPVITAKPEKLKPQILTPKKDQTFTDQKPQFRGTSLPNEKVQIIIRSEEEIQTEITADSDGNWAYRPPTSLSPGNHTITIQTRDSSGILTKLTQSFTVFAADSLTPTPTSTPIPSPTSILSPTPTIFLIPTIAPTFTPTSIPLPTFTPIESKGGLPPTGDFPITAVTIGGIAATLAGMLLFLLTRTIL